MAQSCTYTFNDPDGKEVTIRGMAAMKAYLVDGGMEFFQTQGVRFEGLDKAEAKPAERIADLGEKIGGARKDTSQPTGRTGKAKTEDERPAWARRFEISQIVDIQGLPNGGKWIISDKRNLDWRKQPNRVGGFFDTQQEAEAAIPLVAVGLKHRVVPARDAGTETKWEIWRDVTDRKRVKVVERSFDSRDEAMRYMAEHATEIIETNTTFGEADLPKPDNVQRIGEVRRKGDVNGDNFMEAFGFRGVEFGNWNNQEERQQVMNEAYDGLLDLAEVLGIPPKAISLNGDLALAFGARGQGLSGARAHYEPAKAVINLTKMNGAGALAHEWFHALDHYLARQDGKALSEWVTDKDGTRSFKVSQSSEDNMASGGFRYRDSGVREEVRAAYKSVMDTMANKAEQYVEDSARAEKFVAATRKNVSDELASIRKNLSEQLDPRYYKRNNKPASAELLAEFDTISEKIVRGESLDTDLRSIQNPKSRSMMAGMRLTNDALERINAIYKEVRGRSGFNAERNGFLDRLRSSMQNYQARLKMLAEAQQGSEKERKTLTDFRMDAKSLDQGRGTDYWATPHELAARAFQGYVEDKIAEKGGRSPFLNYAPENVAIYTPWGWKRPYPAGAERKAINAAFDNLASVFKTKETDKGVALFRTTDADPSNQRITRAQADGFLAGFLAKYANAPQITLVNTFDQLPATVQQEARNQGGNASDTKGVFHRGQVYLVAGNHSTVADFEATVFHEVIGHAGVRALFGPDFVKTANRLFMQLGGQAGLVKIMQRRGMGQQASDYIKGISQAQRNELNQIRADMAAGKPGAQRRWNDAIARFVLTEEVFAHIAEQVKDRPSMMDKMKELIGKIRQWLRDKGFAELSNLGETDILFMLSKARQNMQGKDGNITRNGVTVSGNDLMTSDGRRLNKDDPDYASAMRLADLLGLRQEQGVTTFRSEQGTIEVDGVQRPRTNSESRPIHPTEDGIRNFWRWFKDSKVVDADGKPLVMYHGTKADFSAFEMRKAGTSDDGLAGKGFYFTYNPEEASGYAESGNFGKGDAPNVQPVYVSLNNPLRIEKGVLPDGRRVMDVHKQYGHGINAKGGDAVRNLAEEAGHDGVVWVRTDGGVGHAVAFRPNQIKSATGNTGAFDPNEAPITLRRAPSATPQQGKSARERVEGMARDIAGRMTGNPVLDPADPFAAENARLREQDTSLWKKAKTLLRRQLSPGGLLPGEVFAEKIKRDSEFQAVEFDVRHMVGGLERAVQQDFGVPFDKLTDEQMRPINEALAGRVPDGLPDATKTAAVAMRQYIDGLSSEYLTIIQGKIDALMERAQNERAQGRTGNAAASNAINEIELYEKIRGNIGSYVHRSYQAFDDQKWFEKVPAATLNAAREYLKQGYVEHGDTDAEAQRQAEVALYEILKNGTAYDSMEAFIGESKLGAKDLSVLMRRKEVPPQIRALLGEYTDPRLNFAKSTTKMGRLIWNQRFLDRIRDIGMGTFLFEGTDRPPQATKQIAAAGSEVYAPMNGLWTFPEVDQAFRDALGKEQMSDLYRFIVRANGLVKYGKTVLSPTTAMRNWQSAMFFSLANGHFDMTQMKKSISAFREQVSQRATGGDLAYLRHLKQLGVVYDTPYAGEMMRLLQDARMDEILSTEKGSALRWFRKANQLAQGFYSFGDDFWKIIGFENEKAGLLKAGLTAEAAEQEAAKRIRDTYPTYSMVGRGVNWLSRFPLAGTFVSFPAEIIRTTSNMFRMVSADLKSDNPAMRKLGMRRAAGMAMVSATFFALAALSKGMAGVDDDEEEALRDLAPEWQKNSTFLFLGRDEKGQLRYFDLSFLDPYGYFKRPLTAMMRDQPWEEGLSSGLRDLLTPFLGADIAAKAIMEAVSNKKDSGGRVYKENDGPLGQAVDIADHLRKALQPGVIGNVERMTKAAQGVKREGSGQPFSMEDELVALVGWRASTMDPKTALYYRSFEFNDAITEARQEVTKTLRSVNAVSPDEILDARQRATEKQGEAFSEMGRLVQAARNAGMTNAQIMQVLRLSSVSTANIGALIRGDAPKQIQIGPQTVRNAVNQARTMQGDEFAREVSDRYRAAMAP